MIYSRDKPFWLGTLDIIVMIMMITIKTKNDDDNDDNNAWWWWLVLVTNWWTNKLTYKLHKQDTCSKDLYSPYLEDFSVVFSLTLSTMAYVSINLYHFTTERLLKFCFVTQTSKYLQYTYFHPNQLKTLWDNWRSCRCFLVPLWSSILTRVTLTSTKM